MGDTVIEIQNTNFSYDTANIINNINYKIKRNKFYTIIGPNGSGKTTFLKLLSKGLDVSSGAINIENKNIKTMSNMELAKVMAIVPQSNHIEFDFTAEEIVMMGRTPYMGRFAIENNKDIELVHNAMKFTNTYEMRHKKVTKMSGGELQRVIISRAIAQTPSILLLDEPISNLDLQHQVDLLSLIRNFSKEKNVTVVAVLHDLNMAMEFSDEVILLNQGEIVASGNPINVLSKENIEKVYNIKICMSKHPITNKPYIIPVAKMHTS